MRFAKIYKGASFNEEYSERQDELCEGETLVEENEDELLAITAPDALAIALAEWYAADGPNEPIERF